VTRLCACGDIDDLGNHTRLTPPLGGLGRDWRLGRA
jgi:hypothetical protein